MYIILRPLVALVLILTLTLMLPISAAGQTNEPTEEEPASASQPASQPAAARSAPEEADPDPAAQEPPDGSSVTPTTKQFSNTEESLAPIKPPPAEESSVMVGALGAFLHDGDHALFAGGAFLELQFIPHWLHFELAAFFGKAGDDPVTILDLLLKYPYQLSEMIELFGGLGLTLPMHARHKAGTELRPGLTMVAGASFWLLPRLGVVAEGVFNLLSTAEGAHLEGGAIAGIATRF